MTGEGTPDLDQGQDDDDPGHVVVIVPDPPDSQPDSGQEGTDDETPLTEEEESAEALQRWLETAFADGYRHYLQRLAPLLELDAQQAITDLERRRRSHPAGADVPQGDDPPALLSQLPRLDIRVTGVWSEQPSAGRKTPSDEEIVASEEIVFDGDLLATLFDLYVLDGWQAIITIGAELDKKLNRLRELQQTAPQHGTSVDVEREIAKLAPFKEAAFLFRLASNALGQIIREELARIEALAAVRIESTVAQAQTEFAALEGRLEFKTVSELPPQEGEASQPAKWYLVDTELAATYEQALKEAVTLRAALDESLREVEAFRLEASKTTTKRKSIAADTSYAKAVANARVTLAEQAKRAEEPAVAAKMQLLENAPLLALVFPSLKRNFEKTPYLWETMLHNEIEEKKATLADLRDHVRKEVPFTIEQTRGVAVDQQPAQWKVLLELDPPASSQPAAHGFEQWMAELAIRGMSGRVTPWFPLASERTLHELVAREEIEADSFGYVVYFHYVQVLAGRIDERLRAEEASRRSWLIFFSKLSAAASIATLIAPEAAPVTLLLRAVAGAGGFAAQALHFWSIASELQRLQTQQALTAAESSSILEALGQLGELVAIRNDLLDALPEEALIGLLMTLVGMVNVQPIKQTLFAFGFYQDVETLFASDGNEST